MFAFGILISGLLTPAAPDAGVVTDAVPAEYTVVRFENGPVVASRGVQPFVSSGFRPTYVTARPAARPRSMPTVQVRPKPRILDIKAPRNPQAPAWSEVTAAPESPIKGGAESKSGPQSPATTTPSIRKPITRPPRKTGKGRDI